MGKIKFGIFLAPVLAMLLPASALAFNMRITVYASVPEMRNIYVDSAGYITKIVGNTSQNITPNVYNQDNQAVQMTDSINNQYQQFLKDHGYILEASKFYYLRVPVNNTPNSQTIQVNNSPDKLSLTL